MLECWPPSLDAGAVPPRWRREVDASRRLDRRERYLPWACFTLADWHSPVKRPTGRPRCAVTIRAAAAVCLKAVNAGLRRRGHRRVIAAWVANKQPDAGDAGRPVNAIAPPTTAKADAADQSRRYRRRVRQRATAAVAALSSHGEGQRPAAFLEQNAGSPCQRPGCYTCFAPCARSPQQRFCCPSCRQALRRVRQREVARRQRRRRGVRPRRDRSRPPP
jgi:hypothetical protein